MSRLLLILLAVFAAVWWLRSRAIERGERSARGKPPPGSSQIMVSCAQCALHLPASEAVTGRDGKHYCGDAHRALAEGSPPAP